MREGNGDFMKIARGRYYLPLRMKTKSKEMRALSFFVAKNNEKVLEIRENNSIKDQRRKGL